MNGAGHYALNLKIDGSGTVVTPPVFPAETPKMRVSNMGVYVAEYLRTNIQTVRLPQASETVGPAECTALEGGEAQPASREEFIDRLIGTWLLCKSPSVLGGNEAGLEISREGRWWRLIRTESGELARMEGWKSEGSWEVPDNGPGYYQLNLRPDGSGTFITLPMFAVNTSKLRLKEMSASADYVKVSSMN
jgi:hypothetical protein